MIGNTTDSSIPQVTFLYHYFHPDDVISARLFTDLARHFDRAGWSVAAMPCNRGCRDESQKHPIHELMRDVKIHRIWRPGIRQSSTVGRMVNALWMINGWSLRALVARRHSQEVVVIGTDPIFGVVAALAWRLFRPRCKIVHWCHDLYPEALVADGILGKRTTPLQFLRWVLTRAYRRCDLIADLGICMQNLLKEYGSKARALTLVPWALVEPSQPVEADYLTRKSLFGEARLGLLYSGNFGRAHDYARFLELARQLRGESIHFCFAARGNRVDELKAAVTIDDTNISFAGFASEEELEKRLGACDLHLVSLRESWTGTVVPSKFFGAIATGRGVIFAGSQDSAISQWVQEFQLGWVLDGKNAESVAAKLKEFANNPHGLAEIQRRCFDTYRRQFSKATQLALWETELLRLASGVTAGESSPPTTAIPPIESAS